MTDQYDAFARRLAEFVSGDELARSSALAARYWSEPFSGRWFHELADDEHPNEITAQDIVAVSTLSVEIPAPVAIWLLQDEGKETVRTLLSEVPTNIDIWNAGDLLQEGQPLWTLWNTLQGASWPTPNPANKMGTTKISKLLAVKRPRLVPIFDSVVRGVLPRVPNHWHAFEYALSDQRLQVSLGVAAYRGAPEGPTFLRKLDAMLWMIGTNK